MERFSRIAPLQRKKCFSVPLGLAFNSRTATREACVCVCDNTQTHRFANQDNCRPLQTPFTKGILRGEIHSINHRPERVKTHSVQWCGFSRVTEAHCYTAVHQYKSSTPSCLRGGRASHSAHTVRDRLFVLIECARRKASCALSHTHSARARVAL
jgi:hypothetical protein